MSAKPTPPASAPAAAGEGIGPDGRLKIYLLPNLFTAGNLFCGFLALTRIVEADPNALNFNSVIRTALLYILLACILDLLDGRVARMGGFESPFGREFDSLADIVSFGVAPAFLVHRIVLKPVFVNHPEFGWFIASLYVICGAFRLARFNCLAAQAGTGGGKYFLGFPIPAAAGMVASLTLFLLWWDEKPFQDLEGSRWRFILPVILVFLSIMMVSEVKYPTFKKLDWRTQRPFVKTLIIVVVIAFLFLLWQQVLPVAAPLGFTAYLLYGFIRPSISRQMQREIEVDDEPDDAEDMSESSEPTSGKQ